MFLDSISGSGLDASDGISALGRAFVMDRVNSADRLPALRRLCSRESRYSRLKFEATVKVQCLGCGLPGQRDAVSCSEGVKGWTGDGCDMSERTLLSGNVKCHVFPDWPRL